MEYKEKYEMALERARVWKEKSGMPADKQGILDDIFPELAESEDEKVRKALVEMVHDTTGDELWVDYNVHKEEALAWLEKQSEQKPIINVPPRDVILAIWDLGNEWKELTGGSISTKYGTQLDYIQKHWHESEYYLREKQGEHKPSIEMITPEESLDIDSDTYNKIVDECIYGKQKSQRMISAEAKEAMYDKPADKVEPKFKVGDLIHNKWSNHSKEIVAIDDYQYTLNDGMPAPPFKVAIKEQDNWELVEQKPAWSEEDEAHINGIIDYLLDYKLSVNEEDMNVANGVQEEIDWLKSLKERYIWKPIDEQMRALENFIGTIPSYERMFQILKSFYNELKKLKGD